MNPATTQDLVLKAKDGDASAANELFTRYWPRVVAIVRTRLGKAVRLHIESQDIAQEAIMRALRGLDDFEFRDDSSFIRWLSTLVERRIRDEAEKWNTAKRQGAEIPHESVEWRLRTERPTPSLQLVLDERWRHVEEALASLPPEDRELFVGRHLEGATHAELARQMQLSPDAVRMRLTRITRKILEYLERHDR